MITAHGGALGTGRNSKLYFLSVKQFGVEGIEVDIRHDKKGALVLAHMPIVFGIRRVLPLAHAFRVARENGLRINCDVKEANIANEVLEIAKAEGALENVLFTGAVSLREAMTMDEGEVYFNSFNFDMPFTQENVPAIKKLVEATGVVGKGINLNYKKCSDEFVEACVKEGLRLSIYTVDDSKLQEKYIKAGVFNVTTNRPDTARAAEERVK
jgi:hypothetical protein